MPAAPDRRTSQSFALAAVLSASAGAIEAFSVLRLDAFAGAQTGNIVLGSIAASEGQWSAATRYLWPLLAFIVGVLAAQTLMIEGLRRVVRRPYRMLLGLEIAALLVVALTMDAIPRVMASVVITVAVAAQASTFRTVVDVGYNSAFTTGNLMNALIAGHAAIVKRDHEQHVHARRIGLVIASYTIGAVVGAAGTHGFGRAGLLVGAGGLTAALALFVLDEDRRRPSPPE